MTRMGFAGSSPSRQDLLREGLEFLIDDLRVEQVLYLGSDKALDQCVAEWVRELTDIDPNNDFLTVAARVAEQADPKEIREFLRNDQKAQHITHCVRKLPPPPARVIEMIEDRLVVVVQDKSILDEEDIANASLIVYDTDGDCSLNRFGPRYFFTPGSPTHHHVGVVELGREGRLLLSAFQMGNRQPIWQEVLHGKASKLLVST